MCCPRPSATRITPMSSRNASARIFTVGCRSTKSPILPANTSITATLRIMAVTMTQSWPAIPTAVIEHGEERRGQAHQPGEREEQPDPDDQRQRDPDAPDP